MANAESLAVRPLHVVVLAGGDSSERDISLESGAAVCRALRDWQHRVTQLDPAAVDVRSVDWRAFDVALLALHGRFGEDGQVQRLLEGAGIPFTGSGAEASRLAFSKSASKERFFQFGVPTPPYALLHQAEPLEGLRQRARSIGFPLVVKPDRQGSSLGVSLVADEHDLPQALDLCWRFDTFAVLEQAILGTEWTVPVLDHQTLPVIQIETDRPFFDFHAKYRDDNTQYRFDFDVPATVVESITRAARGAGAALGTRGVARVDIRLDHLHRPWVLEVNTIPGMTDHSLVPKSAARLGLTLGELCDRAIESCLRHFASDREQRLMCVA